MGLRSTLFGFVPGRRQAAGTLVASGVQRAALAGAIGGALADDAARSAAVAGGVSADAALDPSRLFRNHGGGFALAAARVRRTQAATHGDDRSQASTTSPSPASCSPTCSSYSTEVNNTLGKRTGILPRPVSSTFQEGVACDRQTHGEHGAKLVASCQLLIASCRLSMPRIAQHELHRAIDAGILSPERRVRQVIDLGGEVDGAALAIKPLRAQLAPAGEVHL